MPSKTTFALVAALAASVSALPTGGYSYVDLVERDPVGATGPAVPAPAAAAPVANAAAVPATPAVPNTVSAVTTPGGTTPGTATPPVAGANTPVKHHHLKHPHGHHHHQQQPASSLLDETHPHHHHHHHRHTDQRIAGAGGSMHKHRHQHQLANSGTGTPLPNSAATPLTPPTPVTAGGASGAVTAPGPAVPGAGTQQTLTRREYYESLYVRDPEHPHHHHHPHGHHGPHGGPHGHHHHHHHHQQQQQQQQQQQADPNQGQQVPDPNAAPADPAAQPQRREYLEERGILESLGLKARVANLSSSQEAKMKKAKAACVSVLDHKKSKQCHKNVDKIIQLTKERNYDIEQFVSLSGDKLIFSDASVPSSMSALSSLSARPY